MTRDYSADIQYNGSGPLLAPIRSIGRPGHVNKVDWSESPLAKRYGISGETKGGPRKPGSRVAA